MPAITFPEYARTLTEIVDTVIATGEAVLVALQVAQRSGVRGFIAGTLQCSGGYILHFREFVDVTQVEPKIMDACHSQDAGDNPVFRYDNAVHRPALPQAEHKHADSVIELVRAPTLTEVVDEILQ